MKYDKQVIIAQLEAKRLELERAEEDRHAGALKHWKVSMQKRDRARDTALRMVRDIRELPTQADLQDDEYFQELSEILQVPGERDNYFRLKDFFTAVVYAVPEPRLEFFQDRSRELARVVEVFRTGAPPEVSTTDLRAFGLMDFLRFGGDGNPRGGRR